MPNAGIISEAVDTAVDVVVGLIARYPFASDEELTCALASLGK